MVDRSDPLWWVEKLEKRFVAPVAVPWQDKKTRPMDSDSIAGRHERLDTLWSYMVGDPPLPKVADEYTDIFRDVMRKARSNYAPMCVNAMLDRMGISGVATSLDKDADGDDLARKIIDESNLPGVLKQLFGYTFAMGDGYGLVVPGPTPTVHAIDPRRCVGIPDQRDPSRLQVALIKSWDPIDEVETARLFLPGKVYPLRRGAKGWEPGGAVEASKVPAALGGIPVVQFLNANGLGEYEPHLDLLDRINDTTLQRMVLTWYQSFRQRAVTFDMPDDEDDAAFTPEMLNEIFRADPGALWFAPAGAEFWESNQADLSPIITAKRDDVKEFAAVTSTPLHLITPDAASGSAEGAALMRESLTHKIRDRRARLTPGLRLMFRIAFAMAGEAERGDALRLLWEPIESNSLAEKGSATAQTANILSRETQLRQIWGMTPVEVAENAQQLLAEKMLGLVGAAPAAPQQPAPAAVSDQQQPVPADDQPATA